MADRMVKKDTASVIPVERKLVKTMAVKTIISAFTRSGSTRGSEPTGGNGNGGRRMESGGRCGWGRNKGVLPKERKLVKTMILEAVFPSRPRLKPKQIVEPMKSKRMSSKGEGSSSTSERKVKKEIASVIPVKRKLVKTMAVEAIVSAFSPSAISRPTGDGNGKGNGGRVYPTRP
ncbi:hypothetical protein IGI04_026919 [Brassica rapa subsp. trilocularis]|nr:hypothetical protein IGI04_026919 [Brassica rapa subsp. trilocularis]